MKIFNLQSKWSLLGWSVGVGLVFNFIILILSTLDHWIDLTPSHSISVKNDFGFPLRLYDNSVNFGGHVLPYLNIEPITINYLLDSAVWIILVFFILSLVRHFKYRG